MARVDDWERFSDAWEVSINADNPKPLAYHKGHKYFSNHDATGQVGCFAGFTAQEAAAKTVNLAHLVIGLNPRIAGFAVTIPHELHQKLVVNTAVRKRGTVIRPEQRLPFYIAFSHLVPMIHALHYHSGFRDKVDFIFDGNKTDKGLRDCIAVYDGIKESFEGEGWYSLMGEITPGDDKELAPLQAADMYAGQLRQSFMAGETRGTIRLWEDNRVKMAGQYIDQSKLEKWSREQNEEAATRILTTIKKHRENPPVMSKRRVKKRKS